MTARPTAAEMSAAHGSTIPDVIAPGLRVLFCGINPGLWSAVVRQHFARPGNRFWPALYASGFTPRLLGPDEQALLPDLGLGITNVAARATARADELTTRELREGGRILTAKAARYRPRWVAIVGITAYRAAFDRPRAVIGPQPETLADSRLWVLPNPSGLNALWTTPRLTEAFRAFRLVTGLPDVARTGFPEGDASRTPTSSHPQ
ncbi:MAG TPA: G/U mismatch-specific DNA glycosylase [Actinocrinis sp.]|uniref:G/U mismatch-specific DNA glycosylase n=1 Tax=Actinocrinis sp. TaxID=1920516 RepID=UPI002DDCE284|nr:G/U mismatch-specific DNA glycosylase [Actinocrinis sp.]HEV3170396.1 G/U mismatch-specific DNA glycosylase [Actinocrinis sp.]